MPRDKPSLLIVDDEFSIRDSLLHWFRREGFRVGTAENGAEALEQLRQSSYEVALLDLRLPGMDGLDLHLRMRELDPELVVIVMTAHGSIETAVKALKQGAFDYLTKPVDPDALTHLVRNGVEHRRLATENKRLRKSLDAVAGTEDIIGESDAMKRVVDLVAQVAPTDVTVLIRGESGTGKELVARAVHTGSPRRYFPLIAVNCGALAESLLESELFGHERGAFTGAEYLRKGKLEAADGGTLFLDEVGTISPKTQVELLRVLETKEFTRIGGQRTLRSDFRIVAATNQPLEELLADGRFRQDLYFRLKVFTIDLPPLRERRSDIPILAMHFLRRYALKMEKRVEAITPEAIDLLMRLDWPGNVRELQNAIERALVVGKGPALRCEDLPFFREPEPQQQGLETLPEMERLHIERVLARTGWNISQSARILQVDRVTLYNRIRKYGLRRPPETPPTQST